MALPRAARGVGAAARRAVLRGVVEHLGDELIPLLPAAEEMPRLQDFDDADAGGPRLTQVVDLGVELPPE